MPANLPLHIACVGLSRCILLASGAVGHIHWIMPTVHADKVCIKHSACTQQPNRHLPKFELCTYSTTKQVFVKVETMASLHTRSQKCMSNVMQCQEGQARKRHRTLW